MPSVPQPNPIGAVWPLGVIIVGTAGTPVPLTHNVGSLTPGTPTPPGQPQPRGTTPLCRQLTFSAPSANAGDIIVNYGNFAGIDANATMLIVAKGTTQSLPWGALSLESQIDITQIWIDAVNSGDKVAVTATDAG